MNSWFADTFYFLALLNPDDDAHEHAMNATVGIPTHLITTQWVLAELADGMASPLYRVIVAAFIRDFPSQQGVTVIPADATLFEAGLSLYESRPDKGWSLTDCISFIVMRQHRITDALTADRHFLQAGFKPLLI